MKPISNRPGSICLFFVVFLFFFSGCLGKTLPSRHYLLLPLEQAADLSEGAGLKEPLRIVIGPVIFPTYLNRPQMVSRVGENTLKFAEFDRWAEPLSDNFTRVLVENYTTLLKTDHVYAYPREGQPEVDFYLRIEVYRFEAVTGRKACLTANWSVYDGKQKTLLVKRKTTIQRELKTSSPAEMAAILNQILNDFSHQSATEIKSLVDKR